MQTSTPLPPSAPLPASPSPSHLLVQHAVDLLLLQLLRIQRLVALPGALLLLLLAGALVVLLLAILALAPLAVGLGLPPLRLGPAGSGGALGGALGLECVEPGGGRGVRVGAGPGVGGGGGWVGGGAGKGTMGFTCKAARGSSSSSSCSPVNQKGVLRCALLRADRRRPSLPLRGAVHPQGDVRARVAARARRHDGCAQARAQASPAPAAARPPSHHPTHLWKKTSAASTCASATAANASEPSCAAPWAPEPLEPAGRTSGCMSEEPRGTACRSEGKRGVGRGA